MNATKTRPFTPHHLLSATPARQQSIMSSLLDAVLHSDAAATPASTAGGRTPRPAGIRSSSARPRGPPSESNGANSDIEAFPDDEVVGARGGARRPNAPRTDIPKVVDVTGETLSLRFQEFLEKYVCLATKELVFFDSALLGLRTSQVLNQKIPAPS